MSIIIITAMAQSQTTINTSHTYNMITGVYGIAIAIDNNSVLQHNKCSVVLYCCYIIFIIIILLVYSLT
jgi:hypothetical protein